MLQAILDFSERVFGREVYIPTIHLTDILEIIILTVIIYYIFKWINNTKAWMLLRGILVLGIFILVAALLQMHTILFLVGNSLTVVATAVIVVFQPELRRALEKLGEKQFLSSVVSFDSTKKDKNRFSDRTKNDIIDASFDMGKVKTGALIVVEQAIRLTEYESTGIQVDALVSKQLLLNIFEHNTPLHDGAVIIREDRVVAATCYLPLSDNMAISKELGTRHRAALGLSEVSDAIVIVVSEETGYVSVASGGSLYRNINREELHEHLTTIQMKEGASRNFISRLKGRLKRNEKKADK